MNIDLVYLWVDGNDPEWQAKRKHFFGNTVENSEINCKGRHANNDELKYSLRSAEKYAPWIRKIFIVTDNQTPEWLDVKNPKINIIDHKDIMPKVCLPCFNPFIIEYFLHKIPDLSEHFLFANDDMFFNADLQPDFFFANDGFPIVRLKKYPFETLIYRIRFIIGKIPGQYRRAIMDSATLVKRKFGKYYSELPHHNIDAYKKSDYQKAIEDIFWDLAENCLTHRVRTVGDLHRSVISFYTLAIGHGHLKRVKNNETMRIPVHKPDFMEILQRSQPKLFCLNDCQRTKDSDRERIRPFLEKLFPEKSAFEK